MSWWEAVFLAIIEGLTEFLPISSTGHLILASALLGRAEEAFVQDFEIAIQGAAILAVVVHSWKRVWRPQVLALVAVAFLPTAIIGFLLADKVEALLDEPGVVAASLGLGGVILIFMDRWFGHYRGEIGQLSWLQAAGVGLIQGLSLVPGVSRAAAAILGAQFMGLSRQEAAEFSFLLAVPTLGAASAYKLLKSPISFTTDQVALLGVGMMISFVVALGAMHLMVRVLLRYGLKPFGVYRIILGLGVLGLLWLS